MGTAVLGALLGAASPPLAAQTEGDWNHPRVLELVDRARSVRQRMVVDSTLRSYRADARGYVYFFLDRRDSGERALVKTDQIALEVYWAAPTFTRQRIVGLRDAKSLPTNINYHLDHLTVVQDEFGDLIRMGDGDEVEAVTHPAAPGSQLEYDFRLVDSLTIRLPGPTEPVRVYEVQVRPRDLERPGFVGSLFLDRGTAAIVRMSFTFTPASYVDPYLDYIRISLENALWNGRHWLPHRQWAELRRELPQLDFPAGSVIRGRFEIGDYEFNPDLPDDFFLGRSVTAAPEDERRAFPFEEGIHEQLDREGLEAAPDLEAIRREAVRMVGRRYASGMKRLRLHLPSVSDAVRFNRVEGVFLGAGLSHQPSAAVAARGHGGFAFGPGRPHASLQLTGGSERPFTGLRASWNDLRDLGPFPGLAGLPNSFSTLFLDRDYTDPFFASGVSVFHRLAMGDGAWLELSGTWERHRSATFALGERSRADHRPVRPVDDGEIAELAVAARAGPAGGPSARIQATAGRHRGRGYQALEGSAEWSRRWFGAGLDARAEWTAGLVTSGAPSQRLFLLGGRETLPGHPYRSYVGSRFWLLRAEGSRSVVEPWLRVRAFGSAGATDLEGREAPEAWTARPTGRVRSSAGVGLGVGWDVIHLDLGRGLNGGGWELLFSVHRRFRAWL